MLSDYGTLCQCIQNYALDAPSRTAKGGLNMDGFEALTEAMNQCAASLEQLANAIRQSETQCGYIKRKNK